jgi:hypothetical protein
MTDQSGRPEALRRRYSTLRDASLSGETDDLVADHDANQILGSLVSAEAFVEDYYTRTAPGFLGAHLGFSQLPELQHIAEEAVERDHQDVHVTGMDAGIPVIATSRPNEPWVITNRDDFDAVLREVNEDIWCDLAGPDAYCVSEMSLAARHKDLTAYADKKGKMFNRSFSFPFEYQGTIVVARICIDCWVKLVKELPIQGVKIQNPYDTIG